MNYSFIKHYSFWSDNKLSNTNLFIISQLVYFFKRVRAPLKCSPIIYLCFVNKKNKSNTKFMKKNDKVKVE